MLTASVSSRKSKCTHVIPLRVMRYIDLDFYVVRLMDSQNKLTGIQIKIAEFFMLRKLLLGFKTPGNYYFAYCIFIE